MKSTKPVSSKKETLKHAHGEVQNQFAKMLAVALDNPRGAELQCCITYSKPCGCIRKFILGGEKWKENPSLQLRNSDEIDHVHVAAADKQMMGRPQIERARELIVVYEHAAELKKEKCYAFNNVEVEGKSLKELRGMIGLGNGRKRSKKYEDYVLQMRSKLRTEYLLCEKAAQKLLGYSINFLYKKLRTNPQKTSRLVATNKAERASKAPRNMFTLEELREMGRNSNGSNQCCGRNCISRLASQNFDKIEDWRRRLDGSGQRVAQEIVAEVLRASSSSLDGQSSFCQNLVHWVTGCSFKKIRRVRDHLKKDPQSLPEHGLKKYWKDKVKGKQKSEPAQKFPKIERQEFSEGGMMHLQNSMGYSGSTLAGVQVQQSNFGMPYNSVADGMYMSVVNSDPQRLGNFSSVTRESNVSTQWPGINVNNSNNMLMLPGGYEVAGRESKPVVGAMPGTVPQCYPSHLQEDKNRGMQDVARGVTSSGYYQQVPGQYVMQDGVDQFKMQQPTMTASSYQAMGETAASHPQYSQQQQYMDMKSQVEQNSGHAERGSVILHTAGSHQQQHVSSQKQPPPYSQPVAAGTRGNHINMAESYSGAQIDLDQNQMVGMAFDPNQMYGQHYYIAAANNGQDNANFFHSGMPTGLTPFILSGGDAENADDNRNADLYHRQSLYILSPIAPSGEKGFSANDLKNFQQLPLTPIQILPTPYLSSGKTFDSNAEGRQEQQQFFFPMPLSNPEAVPSSDFVKDDNGPGGKGANQNAAMHFPGNAALTSLAVVRNGSGLFNLGSWQMPNQSDNAEVSGAQVQQAAYGSGQQWPVLAFQQYPPNVTLQQDQAQAMYNPAQLQSFQVQNASQQQRGNWTHEDDKKPLVEIRDGAQPVQPMGASDGNLQRQLNKDDASNEEKDSNDDEKDNGIITPKIIRDALFSSSFGARVAVPVVTESQTAAIAPLLAPTDKATERTEVPALEMPKLSPVQSSTKLGKQKGEGTQSEEGDDEERCATIGSRVKRFSRDRLRATIDSPSIVLTPFTPLTPNITPAIVIPDTGGDETGKETSASSTGSQQKDGNIFLFPPTHVSRRRAAIRLQGQTVSKDKITKDSPKTPGPFPVAAEGASTATHESEKTEAVNEMEDGEDTKSSAVDRTKSPALTLKDPTKQTSEGNKLPKEKMPVIGFDASNWHADHIISSPDIVTSDDNALNTPTQQPLNTPTSLNTPNQQLDTPNHDLKTPTETPAKSQQPTLLKRKREGSPISNDVSVSDGSSSVDSKTNPPAAKNLRFHCFTSKDFNVSASCSAFRKPSEFASTPTDSVIAQRRKQPRKQSCPLSATSPEADKASAKAATDGNLSDAREGDDSVVVIEDEKEEPGDSSNRTKGNKSLFPAKPGFPGFARVPEGNVMILGNAYDSQTPSFLQLVTPSLFSSNASLQDTSGRQQTPISSHQVNTPVFLHSATFLTPGGSGMLRRISPGLPQQVGASCGLSGTPQVFTFMPSGLHTPKKQGSLQDTGKHKQSEEKSKVAQDATEKKESGENSSDKNSSHRNAKRGSTIFPINIPETSESPALPHKESGLQTPSNLKVVTPSLAVSSTDALSEGSQVFTFPSNGHLGIHQRSTNRSGLVLCTPSKASPSGPIVYHPLPTPSPATGPVALVPIEMLQPAKLANPVSKKDSEVQSTSKATSATAAAHDRSGDQVPKIVVDSADGKESEPGATSETGYGNCSQNDTEAASEAAAEKRTPLISTTAPAASSLEKTSVAKPTTAARPKTLSSSKGFPKPLIVAPINVENPNVQTPTMLHLISPSQHSPSSPLVLYPMIRPPYGQPGMKLQSPLSASSAGGTPPLMILQQRFVGPGGSSSLLKSALMKSMPVFQFPPSGNCAPSAATDSPTQGPFSPPTTSLNSGDSASKPPVDEDRAATTPSAAVSVICGPRLSNQKVTDESPDKPNAEAEQE